MNVSFSDDDIRLTLMLNENVTMCATVRSGVATVSTN